MPSAVDVRRFSSDRPPVVLLGGLNLVRAAGLADIPVIVASAEADSLVLASQFCSASMLLPPLEQHHAVAEKLVRLGERLSSSLGCSVPLFYGDDDYLNLILKNRGRLAQYFRFILNDPEVAAALIDKERFDAFASDRGLPVPRALDWEQLGNFHGAVLVKPKLKFGWEETQVYLRLFRGIGKARVFSTSQELLRDPWARRLRHELVFQQYVPGDDRDIWSFHGYSDANANVLTWFTGRKIRTFPAFTGVSTYLQLAHHDELAALGHRIAARAPLKGPFKIDFKHDAQSGRWYMLEVNARFNLWHHLGAANGINILRTAYDYLLDGKLPRVPAHFGTRVRWLSLGLDWRAYRDLASRGELGFWKWAASLAGWRKVYDVFSWTDPRPFALYCRRRLRRLPRFTARLTRWLFTAS
jgi:predicted ATP-grasp superfamily ATP-dependent carboligase